MYYRPCKKKYTLFASFKGVTIVDFSNIEVKSTLIAKNPNHLYDQFILDSKPSCSLVHKFFDFKSWPHMIDFTCFISILQ